MSELVQIPINEIEQNPCNVRKSLTRIRSLAESIKQYGLLENLVVKVNTTNDKARVTVVGGSRRLEALRLLVEEEFLPEDSYVNCLVVTGDGAWENLVENLCREDVPIWRIGFRFDELIDAGATQKEIGIRVGKTQGYVSTCIQISKGLAPAVVERLEKDGTLTITKNQLMTLARMVDSDLNPDEKRQIKELDIYLGNRSRQRKKRVRVAMKDILAERFEQLKRSSYRTHPKYRKVVEAMIKYLEGKSRRLIIHE